MESLETIIILNTENNDSLRRTKNETSRIKNRIESILILLEGDRAIKDNGKILSESELKSGEIERTKPSLLEQLLGCSNEQKSINSTINEKLSDIDIMLSNIFSLLENPKPSDGMSSSDLKEVR